MSRPTRRLIQLQKRIRKITLERIKERKKLKVPLINEEICPAIYNQVNRLTKCVKFYSAPKEFELQAVLVSLVKRSPVIMTCTHFYVASCFVKKLLSCKLTPKHTHKMFLTKREQEFDYHGKNSAEREL